MNLCSSNRNGIPCFAHKDWRHGKNIKRLIELVVAVRYASTIGRDYGRSLSQPLRSCVIAKFLIGREWLFVPVAY